MLPEEPVKKSALVSMQAIEDEKKIKEKEDIEKKEAVIRKFLFANRQAGVVPLPTIEKIHEGVLHLDDYKLNSG